MVFRVIKKQDLLFRLQTVSLLMKPHHRQLIIGDQLHIAQARGVSQAKQLLRQLLISLFSAVKLLIKGSIWLKLC